MQEGFYSPQELSSRLSVSLKSVYNYINKDKKNIRFIKRGKQTFYSLEDILLLVNPNNVNLQNTIQTDLQNTQENIVSTSTMNLQTDLQNKINLLTEEKQQLEKVNTNLQDTANKYALAVKSEKEEKEKRIKEYTDMNNKYNTALEDFNKKSINYIRKIYGLIALLCIAITYIIVVFFVK